jgi:F-type H+-transporting ATPase subunit epsilon
MNTMRCEIVTQEKQIYSADDVQMVLAPGVEGQLGILPHHAPLLTSLDEGVMQVRLADGKEELFAIHGGFMEVLPDRVTVLADVAEHAEEIDLARAEEARKRAAELMQKSYAGPDLARAEAAMRRSLTRLKVARRKREGRGSAPLE